MTPCGLWFRSSVASSLQKKPSSPSETTPPPRMERGRAIWQRKLERKQSYPSVETPESDVGRRGREGSTEARIWSSVPCLRKIPAARWQPGREEGRVRAGQIPGKLCSWLPRNLTLLRGYNWCQPPMPVPGDLCVFQTCAWPIRYPATWEFWLQVRCPPWFAPRHTEAKPCETTLS